MSQRWRYLADDGAGAAEGLALDEALLTAYRRDAAPTPPTLRLYTYASHAALCGRFQHLEAEIDLAACERTGTAVGRRPTGGGAIVMGAGQLGVAVATSAPAGERPKELLERLSAGIVRGLAELGIEARFRGKNDLEVGGRKIAGLGLYLDGEGAMLFHSSVLADLDIEFMLDVLQVPAAKLGDKAVDAVAERVTTVSRETGERWDGARLRDVVAIGFAKALELELADGQPSAAERQRASELVERKHRAPEWLHQRSPHPDANGTALLKTPAGLVRVYLALSGDTIKSALFTGDMNQLPVSLTQLEEALRWKAADPVVVEAAAAHSGAAADLGVAPGELASAVIEAAGRASERTTAAPGIAEGSCYFPDQYKELP